MKKIIIKNCKTMAAMLYYHKRPSLRIFEYLKEGKKLDIYISIKFAYLTN